MPLFYQQNINPTTRLAVWKIEEAESFFSGTVPVQRQITHPNKRLQHLAGRYLLRYLFPAFPYDEILIADTRKPYLQDDTFHFSISHCGDYAAAIVSSTNRVGIDIEQPSQRVLNIAKKFLHKDELEHFNITNDIELQLPTVLWSTKEAMFKWWGFGEIDFSEMLRIEPFEIMQNGWIDARFIKEEHNIPLQLQYEIMPGICLVWVVS